MTQFADLIATGLLGRILLSALFVAVVLGSMIKFLKRNS